MAVRKYSFKNYYNVYGSIMQFNKNKDQYIHGWYPFVEGYSKEFIRSIINELDREPTHCLEPFTGSGTTPLELQKLGIKCSSFEVSPFMHALAKTKMEIGYTYRDFSTFKEQVRNDLEHYVSDIESILPAPSFRTMVEKEGLKKWNFNREVMLGILDIKYAISKINNVKYIDLFRIALASILLDVSNMYRNGKCLSYKKDWKQVITYNRQDVHNIFLNKLNSVFSSDILDLDRHKLEKQLYTNKDYCHYGDVREKISVIDDNSVDLVITSPPYLNSRDYTDTYMIELRMLDFIKDHESLRDLRKRTLISHVQVKWDEIEPLKIPRLQRALSKIKKHEETFWNDSLLNMIKGYFRDMDTLFSSLYLKMMKGGKIYFNVANSAYYGVEIKTDQIISQIAENNGFSVEEIRKARKIKPSSQQKDSIPYLVESVIVMKKS